MTDEELAITTLGYKRLFPIKDPHWWNKGRCGKSTLGHPITHDLAAEVKQWMRDDLDKHGIGWSCKDNWVFITDEDWVASSDNAWEFYTDPTADGSVEFMRSDASGTFVGTARYADMDAHPRAVCEAALRALNA